MASLELILPAFIAGLFTFLAPCTLPLVPGYLGFISGASLDDLNNPKAAKRVRQKVFLNGVFYVLGFSFIFVVLGSIIGFIGGALFAASRLWLARVGGVFVIFFGAFMLYQALLFYRDRFPALAAVKLPFTNCFSGAHRLHIKGLKPGNPLSSFIFGGAFAIGWTPCVGPVLGAILTLAATEATVAQGALLLGVFSAGLAVPFLVLAATWGSFSSYFNKLTHVLPIISAIGGVFIIILGVLVLTDSIGLWVGYFFRLFSFVNYEGIYNFL